MSGAGDAFALASAQVRRLGNGLTVAVLTNRRAPLVTTVVSYRVGARDESPAEAGICHFLEHLMFKGSRRFGPGEVDRLTQQLGGSNNAYTTHDGTAYWFSFSSGAWTRALEIERDRMEALLLDPAEIEAERRVILEEIAGYRNDPWDALTEAVNAAFFGTHPYGRPVLGTPEALAATGRRELARFHRRRYGPGSAVLVVAGDVGSEALDEAEERFGDLPPRRSPTAARAGRPELRPTGRVELRAGEVARLLVALPAPPTDDPTAPAMRLAAAWLGGARGSRLYRALVDEEQLAQDLSVDFGDSLEPGCLQISAELVPGVEPERIEARLFELLAVAAAEGPREDELERARRVIESDWVFGHERIHEQAQALAWALTFYDAGLPERQLRQVLATPVDEVAALAASRLPPAAPAVVGWSLPETAR